jgi:hypothetical protein
MPNTIVQFLNKDLDELCEENVDVIAFYKTVLLYVQDEMQKRGVDTFTYEPPILMDDGKSLRMRIHYGPGGF